MVSFFDVTDRLLRVFYLISNFWNKIRRHYIESRVCLNRRIFILKPFQARGVGRTTTTTTWSSKNHLFVLLWRLGARKFAIKCKTHARAPMSKSCLAKLSNTKSTAITRISNQIISKIFVKKSVKLQSVKKFQFEILWNAIDAKLYIPSTLNTEYLLWHT